MVEKRQVKLAANTEATERWLRRLFRATNELRRLTQERKRLLKPAREFKEVPQLNDELPTFKKTTAPVVDEPAPPPPPPPGRSETEGDGIPPFLRRLQAMPDPRTKERKAERRTVEREVLDAEITGKRRKLPLTGKAALDAIHK
jgi:hypothetical protein